MLSECFALQASNGVRFVMVGHGDEADGGDETVAELECCSSEGEMRLSGGASFLVVNGG